MKDFVGNMLSIGDHVAARDPTKAVELMLGKVVAFTNLHVRVEYWMKYAKTPSTKLYRPENIVKLDDKLVTLKLLSGK